MHTTQVRGSIGKPADESRRPRSARRASTLLLAAAISGGMLACQVVQHPETETSNQIATPNMVDAGHVHAPKPAEVSSARFTDKVLERKCVSQPRLDEAHAPQREACAFNAGASVQETLGITPEERAKFPIDHVIIVMKENRSFDQYFGMLHERGQPDSEPRAKDFQNLDRQGERVVPFHSDTTCMHHDPDHQWTAMHAMVNDGAMDGFVTSASKKQDNDGHYVLGYYDDSDLPFYYFLANTFAIADRNFASVRSGTWPTGVAIILARTRSISSSRSSPTERCRRSRSWTAKRTSKTSIRPPTCKSVKHGRVVFT